MIISYSPVVTILDFTESKKEVTGKHSGDVSIVLPSVLPGSLFLSVKSAHLPGSLVASMSPFHVPALPSLGFLYLSYF